MSAEAVHYNMHEAKIHLSRIIERVERGEEIIIDRAGTPVVKVVPFIRRVDRTGFGSLAGQVDLSGDWDSQQTNAEIAAHFGIGVGLLFVLWVIAGDAALDHELLDRLRHDPDIYLSPVSLWEITIKQAAGKLTGPPDLAEQVRELTFHELPVTHTHAIAAV